MISEFVIERAPENGGNVTFSDYESLEQAFSKEVGSYLAKYYDYKTL